MTYANKRRQDVENLYNDPIWRRLVDAQKAKKAKAKELKKHHESDKRKW